MQNNQDNLNKNPQGQGGRTEETREGRDTMRGAGATDQNRRNLSSREETEVDEEDDFEDTEEASLDSSDEEEEDADFEGTDKSSLNRGRNNGREQSDRV
jgi:hypothetical protein